MPPGQKKKRRRRKKHFAPTCITYTACMLSHVWLFATLWTVSPQAPLSMGFFQARILEWIAISYSREPSQPRVQTHISCISWIGRQILYHCISWEALIMYADPNANTEGFYGKKIACNPGICLNIPLNIYLMKQNLHGWFIHFMTLRVTCPEQPVDNSWMRITLIKKSNLLKVKTRTETQGRAHSHCRHKIVEVPLSGAHPVPGAGCWEHASPLSGPCEDDLAWVIDWISQIFSV